MFNQYFKNQFRFKLNFSKVNILSLMPFVVIYFTHDTPANRRQNMIEVDQRKEIFVFYSTNSLNKKTFQSSASTIVSFETKPMEFLLDWKRQDPPPLGKRGDEPCAIAPLGTIWHQQPRFVWQGEVRQIKLSRSPSGASQFDLAVTSKGEKLTSSAVSPQSLAAGKEYEYKFEYKGKDGRYIRTQSSTIVEIMENGQRRTEIAKALAAIEQQVPRNTKNRQEQVALQKADYFVKQNLRSDALQEIFSVSSPSSQLQVVQAEIVKSRCSSN